MAPKKVKKTDEARFWAKLYGDGNIEEKRKRIEPGSMVRISKSKNLFEKGYILSYKFEGAR